ncbi:MAG: permease family protein, partial [Candidatus Methanofastidiosia archaeon]
MRWYIGKEREPGETEQPYMGGFLRFRLPFIHYPWEWPDFIQGAILSVVPMGIIAGIQATTGVSYEIALTMVIVNNFLYLLHTSFGDPGIAGWITAGIPLYMTFVLGYATETSMVGAIQAMCALQLIMAIIFLIMAFSGGAKKLVQIVPPSLKSGILLGAGIAAIIRVWTNAANGVQNGVAKWSFGMGLGKFSFSFTISLLLSFFVLFSPRALKYRKEHAWFAWIAKYGIAPAFIIGYIIGVALGEISKPTGVLDQGWIFPLAFKDTYNALSPLVVGWPSGEMFAAALSTAIVAYILAFGDILVAQSLIDEANDARKDELVVYDPNRANFWTGIRNLIEAVIWPYLPLAGPQWTGGQALVVNRFKSSTPEEEYSYWGGATGLFWGM